MTFIHQDELSVAPHPIDMLERTVEENGWAFERSGRDELNLSVAGKWSDHHFSFSWRDDLKSLHLSSTFDMRISDEINRQNIADLLMYVNARLWIGHFDLWHEDGTVVFRHAMIFPGAEASPSQCEALLNLALEACEHYYPAFQFVIWGGKSAKEAVDAAVLECAGAGVTPVPEARNKEVLLIGAGRMGSALLNGWIARGVGPITVVEPKPSSEIKALAKKKKIALLSAVPAKKFSACVVAIKPQVLKDGAAALAHVARQALMISIAAGTDTKRLSGAWGAKARIIRAMPNTPGAIGQGITGLYAAKGATPADRKRAETLLSALGETLWVKSEGLIDSVTAVSGSGPAYLFLMAEALAAAGIAEGLSKADAEKLARATVSGAGALLAADKSPAASLRQAVTSPGGTTEAALNVLMADDGLAALVKRAVAAARKRAEELR